MGDNDRKRDVLNRVLKALIVELRKILKRVAPGYYRRFPNAGRPCHTCAFNPATDNDREHSVEEDHRHFKEHAQLCSGFAILLCPDANRDAKRALIKVARSHRAELNEVVEAGRLVL
jgi:hypothetical protein